MRVPLPLDQQCELSGLPKRRGLKPTATCEVCATLFYASPGHIRAGWGRFCSLKCRTEAWKGAGNPRWMGDLGNATCRTCKKDFRVKPSHKAQGEGQYCSLICRKLDRSTTVICAWCRSPFNVYKSQITGARQCCSSACSAALLSPVPNSVCMACHQWFYRKNSDLLRANKVGVGRFCSMVCKARWMSSHAAVTGHARGKGGRRADLDNRYFRSSWEANWARYLNWLMSIGEIRAWDYESQTFEFKAIKRGGRFYTPDFKITNRNGSIEFHEVKGYFSPADQVKMRRMAKYYPNVVVKLIDRKPYEATARKVSALCVGWEK